MPDNPLQTLCVFATFFASLGCALTAIYIGQQISNERLLAPWLEHATRLALGLVAVAFMFHSTAYHGPASAFLAVACFLYLILRALARDLYPQHRAREQARRT